MFMPCAGSVTSTLQMPASWPLASSTASESVGQCSVSSSSRRGHNLPKTMVSLAACCCTAPLAHLIDIVIAEKPYDSNERCTPHMPDIVSCCASDLLAAIAASEKQKSRSAPQVQLQSGPALGWSLSYCTARTCHLGQHTLIASSECYRSGSGAAMRTSLAMPGSSGKPTPALRRHPLCTRLGGTTRTQRTTCPLERSLRSGGQR